VKRILLALAVVTMMAGVARAVEPSERLADPVLEARARAISKVLRCLVCQNESIDESGADLAHDIRVLLRQRIAAGDSDQEAIRYIVNRYGQFVLLKPPLEPATYVLWFGPPLLLIVAAGMLFVRIRLRRTASAVPAPLNAQDREKLAALLKDGEA
jgi:cytochrome c-type biogenesis protein CcmH